jgi:hypothetical protein
MTFGAFGVNVQTATSPPAAGSPTDTGTLFVVGQTGGGDMTVATLCETISDFETAFGVRATDNAALWDYLDVYFREGGAQAYVGPYPTGGSPEYGPGLDLFDARLGPGQIAIADPTVVMGTTPFTDLAAAALAGNRAALADGNYGVEGASQTIAALETLGGDLPADPTGEYLGLFGSWATAPPPAGVSGGLPRVVPASAVVAALCNRVDNLGNPNRAAAGRGFPLQYVTGFILDPNDADRASLLSAGVNMFTDLYGVLQNYGFNTPVPPSPTTPFSQLNCTRARMWLKAQAQAVGQNYMFLNVDAQGLDASDLQSDLLVVCADLYGADGLYGATPAEAYDVIVNQTVNTDATAAAAQLNAVMEARLSMAAQSINIDLISVPILGQVT